ncbi:ATP-binding protein [Polaribacter sp.]|uniref:ATP-binding protein n=1 Tax=Polaribacter sp. TaxID=1920175 RepID=UPI003EF0ED81
MDGNKIINTSIKPLFSYLEAAIKYRLAKELTGEIYLISELDLVDNDSYLAQFIKKNNLIKEDIILLLLSLIPQLDPSFLNSILTAFFPNGGEFPEFGGVKGKNHRGILPTAETALYILHGNDIEARLKGVTFIQLDSFLFNKKILSLEKVPVGEPKMSGKLLIDEEYLSLLTTGAILKPQLSQEFPASLIETKMEWEDLILKNKTIQEIQEIKIWLAHNETLMNEWNMGSILKPGYRVMFYGAPGTGKTLAAGLLGKETGRDVYRIDLSMVVSKYIGETEKNLSSLFDKAIHKNWILFFDEADSIFGKRTNVRDAHDKYANQEVSYLLQRIEAHPGLVILASNFKNNIDTAFTRRFHAMIEFEIPAHLERLKLWQNNLPKNIPLEAGVSLESLSKKYTITGANIVNVVHYTCLQTLAAGNTEIKESVILEGIKREYIKEGKTLS